MTKNSIKFSSERGMRRIKSVVKINGRNIISKAAFSAGFLLDISGRSRIRPRPNARSGRERRFAHGRRRKIRRRRGTSRGNQ
jgi:hypothetical protein